MLDLADSFDFWVRDNKHSRWVLTPHRHEYFQIHVNVKGNGKHFIGGTPHVFKANSVIFILPYRVHCTPDGLPDEYFMIDFAPGFLRPELMMPPIEMEEASVREFPELAPFSFQHVLDYVFSDRDFAYVCDIARRMMAIHLDRRMGTTERLRGMILDLIGLTNERFEDQYLQMGQKRACMDWRTDGLTRAFRFIDQELGKDITLKQVAEAACLSPNYLSQLLKKQTGMAFVEWLTARRIEKAQELLAYSNLKVSDIAQKVGFDDAAYFTRRFRQRLNLSPLDYRRKMLDANSAVAARA
jgi:AraC-like DNA-binding protein